MYKSLTADGKFNTVEHIAQFRILKNVKHPLKSGWLDCLSSALGGEVICFSWLYTGLSFFKDSQT